MEEIRLQKYLAMCGIASRRKAEELILEGKIYVNGIQVVEFGTKINPAKDKVEYNGKEIHEEEEKVYILLNKPIGYVTTARDQFSRYTVLDLVKVHERIVPVGRLDMYTSGALILTNDGEFVYKVTHPKHEIEKTYNVTIRGTITKEELDKIANGVEIDGKLTSKAKLRFLKREEEKNITRIEVIIHEGRNRQVRKMFEAIGKNVIALHRSKIGNIGVKDLKLGTWRYLKKDEIYQLLQIKSAKL